MTTKSPVTSVTVLLTPLIDPQTGVMTRQWAKWFQGIQEAVNNGLDQQGNVIGGVGPGTIISAQAKVEGHTETIGITLQNIDTNGEIMGPGIDFVRPYLNKNTNNIADGTGNPLAGGKTAYSALVASAPSAGQLLAYSGSAWAPQNPPVLAGNTPAVAHQWLNGYNNVTGVFTLAQPSYSDLTGTPTGASGTITIPAITAGTGTQGSITVVNGIITAFTNPT